MTGTDKIVWQLKQHIKETNTTYAEIRRVSGVSGTTLQNWFSGINSPTLREISKVAEACGFEIVLWVKPL